MFIIQTLIVILAFVLMCVTIYTTIRDDDNRHYALIAVIYFYLSLKSYALNDEVQAVFGQH